MKHCSSEQIHAYVDGRLAPDEKRVIGAHLEECAECRRAWQAVAQIDASLRTIPLKPVSTDFTQRVMEKLPLAPSSPFLFRLFENIAYLFGLLLVLGVMATALILSGVLDTEQISRTEGVVSKVWSNVDDGASTLVSGLTNALQRFFPFVFQAGNANMTVFGVLVILFLAAVDWFVRRKPAHRL